MHGSRTLIDLFVAKHSFQCEIPQLSRWHHCALHHSSPAGPSHLKVYRNLKCGGDTDSPLESFEVSVGVCTPKMCGEIPLGMGEHDLCLFSIHWHTAVPPQNATSGSWCALEKQDEVKLSGNALKMPDSCRWENALNSKYQPQNSLGHRSGRNYNSVFIYSPFHAVPNPYVFLSSVEH